MICSLWVGRARTWRKTSTSRVKTWTLLQPCTSLRLSFQLLSIDTRVSSHQRASTAQRTGRFSEIVPVEGFSKNPETNARTRITVTQDDGIRHESSPAALSKIRSAFPQWGGGKTTGGNASQITDGAAAVLLMTRRKAEELGLPVMAKYVTTSVAGLAPRIMGIGPTYAIPMALEQTGLSMSDVDLFEVSRKRTGTN